MSLTFQNVSTTILNNNAETCQDVMDEEKLLIQSRLDILMYLGG